MSTALKTGRLLLAGILLALAFRPADATSNAPFDAYYAEAVRAFEKGDAKAATARYAPDYQGTGPQGEKTGLTEARRSLAQAVQVLSQRRLSAQIQSVRQQGDQAEVQVVGRLEATVRDQIGGSQRLIVESLHHDRWQRREGQWWLVRSQMLKERNLSEAPKRPSGAAGSGGSSGSGDARAVDLARRLAEGCYSARLRTECDRLNRHVAHWVARCETERTAHACNTAQHVVQVDAGMSAATSRPRF